MKRCVAIIAQRLAVMMAAHIVIQRPIEAKTIAVYNQSAVEVTNVVSGTVDALSRCWLSIVGTSDASRAVFAAAIRKSALSEIMSNIGVCGFGCSREKRRRSIEQRL